jgi:hypothetical protein
MVADLIGKVGIVDAGLFEQVGMVSADLRAGQHGRRECRLCYVDVTLA